MIGFNPTTNKSNTSGATAPAPAAPAAKVISDAPNQLMALGAPPPDFTGSVEGWVKAIQEMLWPQTQVAAENPSTSDAKSEGSEDKTEGNSETKKGNQPTEATVVAKATDVRSEAEDDSIWDEEGGVAEPPKKSTATAVEPQVIQNASFDPRYGIPDSHW